MHCVVQALLSDEGSSMRTSWIRRSGVLHHNAYGSIDLAMSSTGVAPLACGSMLMTPAAVASVQHASSSHDLYAPMLMSATPQQQMQRMPATALPAVPQPMPPMGTGLGLVPERSSVPTGSPLMLPLATGDTMGMYMMQSSEVCQTCC